MARSAGVNLTKTKVKDLAPKASTYPVPDAQVRGLALQVTPAGTKSWVLRFRLHGRQKTVTLGRWPDLTVEQARKAGEKAMGTVRDGDNPTDKRRQERKAARMTDLVARFATDHLEIDMETLKRLNPDSPDKSLKTSTAKEYARILKRHVIPAMGTMRVKDVTPGDVADLLFKLRKDAKDREGTPILANRVRAVVSKLFSKAELWGLRPGASNPARGQDRAPERKKDRHLSDIELVVLGTALQAMEPNRPSVTRPKDAPPAEDPYALAAVRLALLTGMRKSEIIGDISRDIPALKWENVDVAAKVIRLEHHKTVKFTGGRLVPLCDPACTLLESLPEMLGNPHVIPGAIKGQSLVNLQSTWERTRDAVVRVQDKAKIPKKQRVNLSDVTLHDLRRTFASVGARLGYPELFLSALLGHAAGTVTQGYARVGGNPLVEAVETIGGRIAALLAGEVDLVAETKDARLNRQGAS